MGHIELARWADAVLVAPASANFMARLAQGRADDLAERGMSGEPKRRYLVAPAMNQQMWSNAATQANLATLKKNGVGIFGPAEGSQACGEVGPGRMLDRRRLRHAGRGAVRAGELDGLRVLITAGPTWEAIDPVRGLTNRSSGKMGYAVAQAAMEAGAGVTLVSVPRRSRTPSACVRMRVRERAGDVRHGAPAYRGNGHFYRCRCRRRLSSGADWRKTK